MKKLFAVAAMLIFLAGCVSQSEHISSFSKKYRRIDIEFNVNSSSYTLPLSRDKIINYEMLNSLNEEEEQFLLQHGFVAKPSNITDMASFYLSLRQSKTPIVITTDSLLHLMHLQFNSLLISTEKNILISKVKKLTEEMFERAKKDYSAFHGNIKEAAKRNVAYFGVASRLLGLNISIPDYASDMVNEEIKNIDEMGIKKSLIFDYEVDYSQFKVRGHYREMPEYFKTMMWYGRLSFLINKENDSDLPIIQGFFIAKDLDTKLWNEIYEITSFFSGISDDLTPADFINVMGSHSIEYIEKHINEFKEKLLEKAHPKIVSMLVGINDKEGLEDALNKTISMKFFGQRYVPDSYIFMKLVSPNVGMYNGNEKPFTMEITPIGKARAFPRGLDLMNILGSNTAYSILKAGDDTNYGKGNNSYEHVASVLKEEFNSYNESKWNENLYYSWLYALKPLLRENYTGYPAFMNDEWKKKMLQTSLASWAQLRHDTILYAKQSYTPRLVSIPPTTEGYVEPYPQFYARLLAFMNMIKDGLSSFNAINETQIKSIERMDSLLNKLINISVKELEGKELSREDYTTISSYGDTINEILYGFNDTSPVTIADVHTDANTLKVLEEGVGYFDVLYLAYPSGEKAMIGAGVTFSYYEFKWSMENRLNDDEWKEMLPYERNEWIDFVK